jgi:hypothetical protein
MAALVVVGMLSATNFVQSDAMYRSGPAGGSGGVGMILDLVVLRPAGLVATVIGGAAYIVSLPFSAAGGNADQAWNTLVAAPAQFTFARPLGDTSFSTDP